MFSDVDLKKIHHVLSYFDCNEREVDIYLESLKNGPSSVQDLALVLEENRVTIHSAIERLIKKGFLFESLEGKRRRIVAESPDILLRLLREKKSSLGAVEEDIGGVTTLLRAVQTSNHAIPTVSLYEGVDGFRRILEASLDAQNDFLGYTHVELFSELLPDGFLLDYFARRAEKGITSKLIFPRCRLALELQKSAHKYNAEVRILPYSVNWQAGFLSWNSTIAVKSFSLGTLSCTLIENEAVATFYRKVVFTNAWELSNSGV